jgi:thiamine biosynthesis lipoprotein
VVDAAFAALRAVDAAMSLYREDSELTRLNARAGRHGEPVSDDLFALLARARELSVATDGAFDVTVLPLLRWRGAYPELGHLPRGTVGAVGFADLLLDPARREVRFRRDGMALDLGGIAKGFALDRARAVLAGAQVRRARLDLGGSLAFLGAGPEGGWRVAVRDPEDPIRALGILVVPSDAAVSTSANYQRDFAAEGWRAPSHVYDPRSGRPVGEHLAVTVWARDATTADALSTGLLVLGPGGASTALARVPGAGALFVDGTGVRRRVTLHGYPPADWLPAGAAAGRRARFEHIAEEDSR